MMTDAEKDQENLELQKQALREYEKAKNEVVHKSGAKSSHMVPNLFIVPPGLDEPIALRFMYGNEKYEEGNPVYSESNWYKAYRARDVAFFRERGAHCIKHIKREMRGDDDFNPGGNIGGAGWFLSILAFVKDSDPFLYGAIQGKWNINDKEREKLFDPPKYYA